jgi:putative MATE family efflux protein
MSRQDTIDTPTWKRVFELGWPITVEQFFNTLMRTVDVVVTAMFSPTAVAAVGLADLYGQIPLRVGLGLGTASIALTSQDTGRGAVKDRNQVVTQAMLIGALCGIPIVVIGLLFSNPLISILGAESEVVQLGGVYLSLVFAAAPMRIFSLVGSRSLQGTGDTRTPMLITGTANVVNISLTALLGLGIWIAPDMAVIGVGIGTFVGRTVEAFLIVSVFLSRRSFLSFNYPRNVLITKQLLSVSIPNLLEGMSTSLSNFPFNALLLIFGTEANAAYHIGRRVFQQVTSPISRSFAIVSSIIIGQTLGKKAPKVARRNVKEIFTLSVSLLSLMGTMLFFIAEPLVSLFTQDPTTAEYAVKFTRVFSVSTFLFGLFFPLAGALRGAGDTRTPFYARFFGVIICMLGISYLFGIVLDYGLSGVYAGIISTHLFWVIIALVGIVYGDWAEKAETMIAERENTSKGNINE